MNVPSPPTGRNFMKIQNNKLLPVVKQLANESMVTNATNVKEVCGNDIGECGISLDGSWQRRGHTSHNGASLPYHWTQRNEMSGCKISCQISARYARNGKEELMTLNTQSGKLTSAKLTILEARTACMQLVPCGFFKRSYISWGLKYKNVLGDSDSSTYNNIVESKPYDEECIPNKLERIGHVQKRVGSRLRN